MALTCEQQSYTTAHGGTPDAPQSSSFPRVPPLAPAKWGECLRLHPVHREDVSNCIWLGRSECSNSRCIALYEDLRYDLMLSPSVSGSQGYRELATAAKAEERRLAALRQRQQ